MNNYAISSSGIAEALQRSASALAAAGNSLDESAALAVGANSVIQNPARVGTALKTLSLRLTKTKTEMEEMGEETDFAANSVSEYRAALLNLTNQKVDIQLDKDTYKNTTQILREMAGVWDEMTMMDRQAALQLMGGAYHANTLMSIITNWEDVENAIVSAENSAGSADREMVNVLDSIQGKLYQFQSAVQGLSTNLFTSDFLKGILDGGRDAIGVLDKLVDRFGALGTIGGTVAGALAFGNIGMFQLKNWNSTGKLANANNMYRQYANAVLGSSRPVQGGLYSWFGSQFDLLGTGKTLQQLQLEKLYTKLYKTMGLKSDFAFSDKNLEAIDLYNQNLKKVQQTYQKTGDAGKDASNMITRAIAITEKQTDGLDNTTKRALVTLSGMTKEAKQIKGVVGGATEVDPNTLKIVSEGKQTSFLAEFGKRAGLMALNSVAFMGIGAAIEGVFGLINKAIHYNENQIAEGNAVIQEYADKINDYNENISTLEEIKVNFDTLSYGVDNYGRNLSLSTEEYAQYQDMVSQIVGLSPSLIAAYDAEGNALANKNGLIEKAIELQKDQIKEAGRERTNPTNLKEEYEKYQAELSESWGDMFDAELSKRLSEFTDESSWVDGFRNFFRELPLVGDFFDSEFKRQQDTLFGSPKAYLELYKREIGDILSGDTQDYIAQQLGDLRQLDVELNSMLADIERINHGMTESMQIIASNVPEYENLADSEKELLNNIIAGFQVTDYDQNKMKSMAETLVHMFDQGVDMDGFFDLGKLKKQFSEGTITMEDYVGKTAGLAEKLADLFNEWGFKDSKGKAFNAKSVRAFLGIDTMDQEVENLKKTLSGYKSAIHDLDLSGLTNLADQRQFHSYMDKLKSFYDVDDIAKLSTAGKKMAKDIAQAFSAPDRSYQLEQLEKFINIASNTKLDTTQIETLYDSMRDASGFTEGADVMISGLEKLNEALNASGIEEGSKRLQEVMDNFLNQPELSLRFAGIDEQFDNFAISADQYDQVLKSILEDMGLIGEEFDNAFGMMAKSVNGDLLGATFADAAEAAKNFLNAGIMGAPLFADQISQLQESLSGMYERAQTSHDLGALFESQVQINKIGKIAEWAEDPLEGLTAKVTALQNAMGEVQQTGYLTGDSLSSLLAMGPDATSALKVTRDGVTANDVALAKLIKTQGEEAKAQIAQQRAMASNKLAEYIAKYNELEAKKKDATSATKGLTEAEQEEQRFILGRISSLQEAIASYSAMVSAIDQVIGEHAQMQAALQAPTRMSLAEETASAVEQAAQYLEDGAWVEAWDIMLARGMELPKTMEATKAAVEQLQRYFKPGDDFQKGIDNLFTDFLDMDKAGELNDLLASFKMTAEGIDWYVPDWEFEALAQKIGLTKDELLELLEASGSFSDVDMTTSIDDNVDALKQQGLIMEGVNGEIDKSKTNWEGLRDYLSGLDLNVEGWQAFYDAMIAAGFSVGELKEQFDGIDGDFDYLSASLLAFGESVPVLEQAATSAQSIDLDNFIAQMRLVGAESEEIQGAIEGLMAENPELTITVGGNAVGELDEIRGHIDAACSEAQTLDDALSGLGIDKDADQVTIETQIKDADLSKAQLEEIHRLANAANNTNVMLAVEANLKGVDDARTQLQDFQGDIDECMAKLDTLAEHQLAATDFGLEAIMQECLRIVTSYVDQIKAKLQEINGVSISVSTGAAVGALQSLISKAKEAASAIKSVPGASGGGSSGGKSSGVSNFQKYGTSTPSKKKAVGTKYAVPGPAMVNDGAPVNGSSAELIINRRTGSAYIANGGQLSMVNLQQGDQVLTAKQTQDVLNRRRDREVPMFAGGSGYKPSSGKYQMTSSSNSKKKNNSQSVKQNWNQAANSANKLAQSANKVTSSMNQASESASEAAEEAKTVVEIFEEMFDELEYMRDMDQINDQEYWSKLAQYRSEYLMGDDEDSVKKRREIDVKIYQHQKEVAKDAYEYELKELERDHDRRLVLDGEYFTKKRELTDKMYQQHLLSETEYRDALFDLEEEIYDSYDEIVQKRFEILERDFDKGIMLETDYYKKRQELNEKFNKNRADREKEYLDQTVENLNSLKEAYASLYSDNASKWDKQVELGLISQTEALQNKWTLLGEIKNELDAKNTELEAAKKSGNLSAVEKAAAEYGNLFDQYEDQRLDLLLEEREVAQGMVEAALSAALSMISRKKAEIEHDLKQKTDPIEREIKRLQKESDAIQRELNKNKRTEELERRPLEDKQWNLNRQKDDIERYYELKMRPYEREQKDLQMEQARLDHEEELALRPVEKEIKALQRQIREITKMYDDLIKPIERAEKLLNRQKTLLEREREVMVRPLERELTDLNRDQTFITRDYELRLRPLQKELKALQKAKELEEKRLEIDKARYNLAKAQTERVNMVYKEGFGFVYEADRDAIREAQAELNKNLYQDRIDELEEQIEQLEEERDEILEPLEDQIYDIGQLIEDINYYFDKLIEPIDDELFDLGITREDLEWARDELLDPLNDALDDLQYTKESIQDLFDTQLDPIKDRLSDIDYLLQVMAKERDDLLEPIDDELWMINRQLEDIARYWELINRELEDHQYEINELLQEQQDKLDVLNEEADEALEKLSDAEWHLQNYNNEMQEANDLLAMTKVYGKDVTEVFANWVENVKTVKTQLHLVSKLMGDMSGDLLSGLTPDLSKPGPWNISNSSGTAHEIVGTRPYVTQQDFNNIVGFIRDNRGKTYQGTTLDSALMVELQRLFGKANESKEDYDAYKALVDRINLVISKGKYPTWDVESLQKLSPVEIQNMVANALNSGVEGITINDLVKAQKMVSAFAEQGISALKDFKAFLVDIAPKLPKQYASGRRGGTKELAVTQEAGPEAIMGSSKGRYTFLSPGDYVFTREQTENLWKMSRNSNLASLVNSAPSRAIKALAGSNTTNTISIGDVIVQHADNPEELSQAIVRSLPNQILVDLGRH